MSDGANTGLDRAPQRLGRSHSPMVDGSSIPPESCVAVIGLVIAAFEDALNATT